MRGARSRSHADLLYSPAMFSQTLDGSQQIWGLPTLMADLEDGPEHLVLLLALVRCILGVLHLVGELQ